MPLADAAIWTDELRRTLERYDEALVRQVAARLIKPRSHWPVAELIDRCLAAIGNPAVIDRRIKELEPAARRVMALVGRSRQPRWHLGNLVELVISLGHPEGLPPLLHLLESGLLFPLLPAGTTKLKTFEQWLGQATTTGLNVFAHPALTARALGEDLGLPGLASDHSPVATPQEADGLEWPLRLGILWQQVVKGPLRRTQQGEFFKRDLERLGQDSLLAAAPADGLATLPDPALLMVALAEIEGIVQESNGELRAGALPAAWDQGLPASLAALWSALPHLETWNVVDGWRPELNGRGNPYPSGYLLGVMLLAQLPEGAWAEPAELQDWIFENHPFWNGESVRPSQRRGWLETFLLGLAHPLRLVQAGKSAAGHALVRLSPYGRWLIGLEEKPPATPAFPQTLLVQPNMEIVAYRQGLTPALVGQLSRFATWKTLGAACQLQLEPESIYRGLESGLGFADILQVLERHGMRPVPPGVVDVLKTWANKRERIAVYPSAALFEFHTPEDAAEALARGLPGLRIADRLVLVPSETDVDFRHFRLSGTRDYGLPPDRCVVVEEDGVGLTIDLARSDLMVETELQRFAEPVADGSRDGKRRYRITPGSLARNSLGLRGLEEWFAQRTGEPLSPAARLLLTASQMPPVAVRKQHVLHVVTADLADGLWQWPGTRALLESRLGPTTLAIAEENLPVLRQRLEELGLKVQV